MKTVALTLVMILWFFASLFLMMVYPIIAIWVILTVALLFFTPYNFTIIAHYDDKEG